MPHPTRFTWPIPALFALPGRKYAFLAQVSARTLLSEVDAAASAITASRSLERFSARPQAPKFQAFPSAPLQVQPTSDLVYPVSRCWCESTRPPKTEYQLVTRANSHYNVWIACVLYLCELLLATEKVTAERLQVVYVLPITSDTSAPLEGECNLLSCLFPRSNA